MNESKIKLNIYFVIRYVMSPHEKNESRWNKDV